MTPSHALSIESASDIKAPLLADTATLLIQGESTERKNDVEAQTLVHGIAGVDGDSTEKIEATEESELEKSLGRKIFAAGAVIGGALFMLYCFVTVLLVWGVFRTHYPNSAVLVLGSFTLVILLFLGFILSMAAIMRFNAGMQNANGVHSQVDKGLPITKYATGAVLGCSVSFSLHCWFCVAGWYQHMFMLR